MNFVQLDKNTGDKRLKAACLKEGIVECDLLPRELRDEKDAIVLEYAIRNEFVTFTFDHEIHYDCSRILAGRNPGILILRQDEAVLQQINTKTAPQHLRRFKESFPDWHAVPCRNSVLELTPTCISLFHSLATEPALTYFTDWQSSGWQSALIAHLEANAAGNPILRGSDS